MTVAPPRARPMLGGLGTQRSSQTSTPSTKSGISEQAKSKSVPKGTSCPSSEIVPLAEPSAGVKWRNS